MDTKQTLIQIAAQLFAQHGYDAVGVKQIVDQAKVTKPTLYHHFGSKEGLLHAVLAEGLSEFNRRMAKACAYTGNLHQNLEAILRFSIEFSQQQADVFHLYRFMGQMPATTLSAQAVKPYLLESHRLLQHLFQAASEDHGNMQGREVLYATHFLAYCFTYANPLLEQEIEFNDTLIQRVIHSFAHGIFS